jgi:hypothetical protein
MKTNTTSGPKLHWKSLATGVVTALLVRWGGPGIGFETSKTGAVTDGDPGGSINLT